MKVYFAHPYNTVGSDGEQCILEEMAKRGWEVLNPFENNPDEEVIERIKRGDFGSLDAFILVEKDLENLDMCHSILVWLPGNIAAVGTICEMVYAFKAHKYVVVIHQKDGIVHPWVVYHADLMYKTIGDFVEGISVVL